MERRSFLKNFSLAGALLTVPPALAEAATIAVPERSSLECVGSAALSYSLGRPKEPKRPAKRLLIHDPLGSPRKRV